MPHTKAVQTFTSALLALAVFLSGIHGKDVALPLIGHMAAAQKRLDDTPQPIKITADLHHHSETSVKIQPHGDGQQADSRSLRLLHHRKFHFAGNRLADRLWMWWRLNSLHLT